MARQKSAPNLAQRRYVLLMKQLGDVECDGKRGWKTRVSSMLGVPQSHGSMLLAGHRNADWDTCLRAAKRLGMSLDFFTDETSKSPDYRDYLGGTGAGEASGVELAPEPDESDRASLHVVWLAAREAGNPLTRAEYEALRDELLRGLFSSSGTEGEVSILRVALRSFRRGRQLSSTTSQDPHLPAEDAAQERVRQKGGMLPRGIKKRDLR